MKKAANMLYACIYMENTDPLKYEKILNQQKSFGNNQFAKTIVEANSILSNHTFESNKNKCNNQNKSV